MAVEAVRVFDERTEKAVLRYKVRLWKMNEARWAHRVYEWSGQGSKWVSASIRWERKCGLAVGDAVHCLLKALQCQLI